MTQITITLKSGTAVWVDVPPAEAPQIMQDLVQAMHEPAIRVLTNRQQPDQIYFVVRGDEIAALGADGLAPPTADAVEIP